MADHEVFEEPSFVLQKGAMLPVARLAYKTVGALNAARAEPINKKAGRRLTQTRCHIE